MSVPFRLKTLADASAAVPAGASRAKSAVPAGQVPPTASGSALSSTLDPATCPICRRTDPADMCVRVDLLPDALRTAAGWAGATYVCAACRTAAHRSGVVTLEVLHAAHGAPAAVLAIMRAHDVVLRAQSFGRVLRGGRAVTQAVVAASPPTGPSSPAA